MIVDELDPIVEEIFHTKNSIDEKVSVVEEHIRQDEKEFEGKFNEILDHHDDDKEKFDNKINALSKDYDGKLKKILESYKFRFIQLCKIHLHDGFITNSEWEQLVAFYDVYHGLGGNGLAEEYYEKVKELDMIKDEDDPRK